MLRFPLARMALLGGMWCVLSQAAAAQGSKNSALSPQTQKINELIAKGWADAGIKKPAALAPDNEFLRRVFIDLIGRIATPEEVIDFENDRSPNKRYKLVQRLLHEEKYVLKGRDGKPVTRAAIKVPIDYTNDYAEHWANLWTVALMTRTGHSLYRQQMQIWLEVQLSKANFSHKQMVTALLTANGKSNENGAINFIMYHLGEKVPPASNELSNEQKEERNQGQFDAVPITSRVTKLFLGIQTQCTQCHDHPQNKQWLQADFWGVNAFFRQTVRSATPTPAPMARNNKMDNPVQITLSEIPSLNSSSIVRYERRDGKMLATFPVMLKDMSQAEKGEKSTKMMASLEGGKTRRQQLAEWVVNHDNFSKAYVNRIWGHFFGRGLMKEPAFDDFGNTEVIHPDLLNYLGEEFAHYNYDPKKLFEWICTSDVYQLSHVSPKEYIDVKYDPYFAHMPLKALSPEVLFESLMIATKTEGRLDRAAWNKLRDEFMGKLVKNFGDDEGNELNFNGTVVQALLMMNGKELNDVIGTGKGAAKDNAIADVFRSHISRGPASVYDELFLMTLNRHPTPSEIAKLEQIRSGQGRVELGAAEPKATKSKAGGTPAAKPPAKGGSKAAPKASAPVAGASPVDVAFYQDVFWALLNTNEFMLNH